MPRRSGKTTGGVTFSSPSASDPSFYDQKRAAEKRLGRSLSTAEFLAEHYQRPEGSTLAASGTSIFDPVLCELVYRWFCPPKGLVLDPFAGGSVRGIVAARLGRRYLGIELRPEQIAANRQQAEALCPKANRPRWIQGDARDVAKLAGRERADLVFSCPPYADLEVYSDDPRDLSTLPYEEFRADLAAIITACIGLLKPDRFACFVVGDVRDRRGAYRNFPGHTIEAFQAAGAALYNEAVFVTPVGSLPIRVGRQFETSRKLGKTHQNVLVFVKGEAKRAAGAIGTQERADATPPLVD